MTRLTHKTRCDDSTWNNADRAVERCGRRLTLGGRVQGLGVRPAIFGLASEFELSGFVRNTADGVEIHLEGPAERLARFEQSLRSALPVAASLSRFDVEPVDECGFEEFTIAKQPTAGPLAVRVPEDRAVCADCLRDIAAVTDRRHGYPFTSCTQCGPRYTVIRAMPFEREDTAMAEFPLCSDCDREYRHPRDRRFHAQTTACANCGPHLWCSRYGYDTTRPSESFIAAIAEQLRAGRTVAVRGLGGYQLFADATNETAVARLRERKGRRAKPLAVMVDSIATAEQFAYFDHDERTALTDPSAPIVLVRARANNGLAEAIHPQFDTIGLMVPTTPLHALLARESGMPLVCTSGNREGDPLEYEVDAAELRLAGIADAWLHHDREIVRPIDDSVVRVIAGRRVTIRLARGLAPLALDLPELPPTLAMGGYFKSAVAWSNGTQSALGPHIGDQETLPARERFLEHLADCRQLYRFKPELLVHDMHPEYFSTQWAKSQPLPTIAVQHHHAHVAAGMLEHNWLDRTVLGVAWDGTGYGTDGTIWGGEFLVATAASFERLARLRPFRLPGGEAAIREPWRIAVALCEQLSDPEWVGYVARPSWQAWDIAPDRITAMRLICDRPQLSPLTSSVGRLFDAAAALILGITNADFDGQAAMLLEAVADRAAIGRYNLLLRNGELAELDWRPMIAEILADCAADVDRGTMAMKFHRGLAQAIIRVCRLRPDLPVVLTGGVFQNRLLTELVADEWDASLQMLGLPGLIPPNDGGLAAGQLVVAAARGNQLPCV